MVLLFKKAAKISLIVVLFALCFIYFTLPSFNEYKAEQIIVTTSEEKIDEILTPAVTVCAQDSHLLLVDYENTFLKYCASEMDIRRCVDNATFNFSSTILNARKGFTLDGPNLIDPSLWIPEITLPSAGKCYTLNTSQTLEKDFMTGTLRLELSKDLKYYIFVHDINYFVQNQNPFGVPINFKTISPGEGWTKIYKMRTVKRKNIKNCNPDPSYKFTTCVRSSLSATAGCRLPWDPWTDQAVTVCTTMEQFRYSKITPTLK